MRSLRILVMFAAAAMFAGAPRLLATPLPTADQHHGTKAFDDGYKHGHDDAHEIVRRLTIESERSGKPLLDVALQSEELRTLLSELPPEERAALDRPEEYRGLAASVARETASSWRDRLRRYLVE